MNIALKSAATLGLLCVFALLAAGSEEKKKESATTPTATGTTATGEVAAPVAVAPVKPVEVVDVSAGTLYNDYKDNELAADKKYKGKLLRISGAVDSVAKTLGSVHVRLKSSGSFGTVSAEMDEREEEKAAELTKGQAVTLVCVGHGKTLMPHVKDCRMAQEK